MILHFINIDYDHIRYDKYSLKYINIQIGNININYKLFIIIYNTYLI